MNKKAISPLIASVLLIGFTVALAVVVMTWGGGFIKKTTEQTGASAENLLLCNELDVSVKQRKDSYVLFDVINNCDIPIENFIVRWYNEKGEYMSGYELRDNLGLTSEGQAIKYAKNAKFFPIKPYTSAYADTGDRLKYLWVGLYKLKDYPGAKGSIEFIPIIKDKTGEAIVCSDIIFKTDIKIPET